MDKVKVALAVLKKYHFWVLCLLIVIFGMLVWTTASADLSKQFTQRKSKLDSALKSAHAIAGETGHPNEKTNQLLISLNDKQRQEVLKTWTALYEKQKEQNPWPKPPILSNKFLEHVKSRGPNEDIKLQYREMYQSFIRNYIPTLFEIVDYRHQEEVEDEDEDGGGTTVKKNPMAGMGMGGPGMGGMAGMAAATMKNFRMVGVVDWDESDRNRILQNFWWQGAPTTVQLRMAQEDIWVYEALLRIIKATNEGATNHYNAAIKRIAALEIGQAAAGAVSSSGANLMGAVQGGGAAGRPGMGGGMGMGGPGMGMGMGGEMGMGGPGMGMGGGMGGPGMGMGGGMGGPGMGMGGGMGGGPGMGMGGEMGMGGGPGMGMGGAMGMDAGMGGAALSAIDQAVLNGRYVDQNNMPLMATSPPPYAEFKMMPIRMSLLMDHRKIPKLLVECANSTMPVEVQRVRINPEEGLGPSSSSMGGGRMGMGGPGMGMGGGMGATGMGGGMGATGMGGGMGMGGEMGMGGGRGGLAMGGEMGMGMPGMGGRMGMNTQQTEETNLQEVPVEIVGIIYIYNPPALAKVGTGTAGENAQAMPGAPGDPNAPGGAPAVPGGAQSVPGEQTPAAGTAAPQPGPPAAAPPGGMPPGAAAPGTAPPGAAPPGA